jgi:hypothetical protein
MVGRGGFHVELVFLFDEGEDGLDDLAAPLLVVLTTGVLQLLVLVQGQPSKDLFGVEVADEGVLLRGHHQDRAADLVQFPF